MKLTVGREEVQNYEKGSKIQWLLTNSIGGFASSTAIGLNTSQYHGLLFASTHPPRGRKLICSKVEEEIGGKGGFSLSTNKYPGVVHPEGYKLLQSFELSPLPTYRYAKGALKVKKTIGLVHRKNTLFINYEVENSGSERVMKLRPLMNCRGLYDMTHAGSAFEFNQFLLKDGVRLKAEYPASPFIYVRSDKARFKANSEKVWYRKMEYESDLERGEDWHEDHYNPGAFEISLPKGKTAFTLLISTESDLEELYDLEKNEVRRLKEIERHGHDNFEKALRLAADNFIVERNWNRSIIAGYPWFDDWGRDAMVALSGLCFATGRIEDGKGVLLTFGDAEKNGIIPNAFDEEGKPHYNSADASLWFINAVYDLYSQKEEKAVREKFWPLVREIIEAYSVGTNGVSLDSDGLLKCRPGLTWMDAFIGGKPVTPRGGKPVEVEALWYNALKIAETLAEDFGESAKTYREMAQAAAVGLQAFWNGEYLDDCLGDKTLRPNQLIALSLPFTPIGRQRGRMIVEAVEEKLFTPFGLRTLAPGDPNYRGKCVGDRTERDMAYHQGTVWPWLIGPYITAKIKFGSKFSKRVKDLLINFEQNLKEGCLGNISEIFDGDPPYHPRGCIAQAWSVGEILRCYKEDVLGHKKKHRN